MMQFCKPYGTYKKKDNKKEILQVKYLGMQSHLPFLVSVAFELSAAMKLKWSTRSQKSKFLIHPNPEVKN